MNVKKWSLLACSCALMLTTGGCQKQETSEYRFASYYEWFLGQPAYEDVFTYMEEEKELQIDATYGDEAYIADDHLFLQANDTQRDALIEQNEQVLQEAIAALEERGEGFTVEYPDDYAQVTITLDPDFIETNDVFSEHTFSMGGDLFAIANITLANRILTTKDSDIGITVTLKNGGSGHILSDACYPYQAISYTQNDWESSKQQDVEIPSAREGYTKLFVRVAEVDEQRIIFTPEEGRTLYAEDAQLELCLDSVYADDVYIPYQLKQDDTLVLEVNGRYALHEDGDDIADIAPISIIPKRYVGE